MKKLRYSVGQEVTVKEGSVFAEAFCASGVKGVIVSLDTDGEFDYRIKLNDDGSVLLINDDELI